MTQIPTGVTWPNVMDELAGDQWTTPFTGELPIVLLTGAGTFAAPDDPSVPQPYGAALAAAEAYPNVFVVEPVNYPASLINPQMGASAMEGYNEIVRLTTDVWPNNLWIPFGYSQAAIFVSWWWKNWCIPNGKQSQMVAAITEGNPLRCPGQANGNAYAGWGMPGLRDGQVTGGISGRDCLTAAQTPSNWFDFVWLGSDGGASELYTNAPVGANPWSAEPDVGIDETLIYNIVMSQNFGGDLGGLIAIIEQLAEQFTNPVNEVIGIAEGIWNGLTFAFAGPAADHYSYDTTPMIEILTQVVAPQFA